VDGRSLAELARQQPLSPRQAAEYTRDAAEAVHYAHQQGTLHRDLKPANILIDRQGWVRITDFGLAKKVASDSDLTLTGQILGTPSYMPPEQATGKRSLISAASDIYSLGAVLYELLTGRPPFRGETHAETLRQVESLDPVSPRLLNPSVPRDLETICLKCLRKEPAKRFATAKDLGDDLRRWLNGQPIRARRTSLVERAMRSAAKQPGTTIVGIVVVLFTGYMIFRYVSEQVLIFAPYKEDFVHQLERQEQLIELLILGTFTFALAILGTLLGALSGFPSGRASIRALYGAIWGLIFGLIIGAVYARSAH
jgi:eukaryotic-like serine/threonine-protein kinase